MIFLVLTEVYALFLRTEVWPPSEKHVIEDDGEYETFYDGDGALVKQPKGADFETAMPQHLKYPITSREDWAQFKVDKLEPDAPGREVFELNLDGHNDFGKRAWRLAISNKLRN